jgi:hypothetical protein
MMGSPDRLQDPCRVWLIGGRGDQCDHLRQAHTIVAAKKAMTKTKTANTVHVTQLPPLTR